MAEQQEPGPIIPAAKAAADADWVGDPPADNWERLTFGEQVDYAVRVCRTAGAIYETRVSTREISVKVTLPESMAIRNLSETHARVLEQQLHLKMEAAIVSILKDREYLMAVGAEAAAYYRERGQPIPAGVGYAGEYQPKPTPVPARHEERE